MDRKIKRAKVDWDENDRRKFNYPTELEENLFKTEIYVQAPYQIVEDNGEKFIISSCLVDERKQNSLQIIRELENVERDVNDFVLLFGPEDRLTTPLEKTIAALNAAGYILYNPSNKVTLSSKDQKKNKIIFSKTYDPFEEKTLLQDIYKVDTSSAESILFFCNRYGLLGLNSKVPILNTIRENLENFTFEVNKVQSLMNDYWAIQDETDNSFENETAQAKENLLFAPWNYISHWYSDKESWVELKKIEFAYFLENGLSLVSPMIKIGEGGVFLPCHSSPNLLGAIYFRLYEMATGDIQLFKCKFCGSLFMPRRSDAKYCSPREYESRSPCENRYNQMVYWSKKQIISGKKTVEEIARMKNRSVEEVKSWL